MGRTTTAAYDPVSYAHHCMIDRLWYLWQIRHGNGSIPPSLPGLPLAPFGKNFEEVLDILELGYDYSACVAEIEV